jgi:hypothetical protein
MVQCAEPATYVTDKILVPGIYFTDSSVLEFKNNLWGLGTDSGIGLSQAT